MINIVERLRDCENYEDQWQLRQEAADEIERLRKERDELASAFIVLWISQDAAERTHWDAKAVERFDALLAKLGADKTGEK